MSGTTKKTGCGRNIKPADIVGIAFPYTDLSARKKRPALVLTHLDHRGNFIALPVTSVRMQQLALCIDENSLKNGNLPKTSWVRYDKIFTLNSSLAKKKYGETWIAPDSTLQPGTSPCIFENRKISGFKGFNKNPRLKKETGKNISKNKRGSSYGEKI